MQMLSACVIDANVALKLVLRQEFSDQAAALIEHVASDAALQIHVPDLFFAEITNVLVMQTRLGRPKLRPEQANIAVESLHLLPFAVTLNQLLGPRALELALMHRLNGYDSIYVALAERTGIPFITADRKLVTALRDFAGEVRWLGDIA